MQKKVENIYLKPRIVFAVAASVLLLAASCGRIGLPEGEPQARIVINGRSVAAEVVDTPSERALGLSGRTQLGEGQGMLFVFDKPGKHSFWMNGMLFPLDIIWIEDGMIVDIAENMPAPAGGQPASYTPSTAVRHVLEVNAGTSAQWGWTVGTPVAIEGSD